MSLIKSFLKTVAAAIVVAFVAAPQVASAQTINILAQTVDVGVIDGVNVSGSVVGPGAVSFGLNGGSLLYFEPPAFFPAIAPGQAVQVTIAGTLNTTDASLLSSIFAAYQFQGASEAALTGPVAFFVQYFAVYSVPDITNSFSLAGGNVTITTATIQAVPAPLVGAGIPVLAVMGAFWMVRRRRNAALAV